MAVVIDHPPCRDCGHGPGRRLGSRHAAQGSWLDLAPIRTPRFGLTRVITSRRTLLFTLPFIGMSRFCLSLRNAIAVLLWREGARQRLYLSLSVDHWPVLERKPEIRSPAR